MEQIRPVLQGFLCGRGKPFVDIEVGSSSYQLRCRAVTTAQKIPEHIINIQQNRPQAPLTHSVRNTTALLSQTDRDTGVIPQQSKLRCLIGLRFLHCSCPSEMLSDENLTEHPRKA